MDSSLFKNYKALAIAAMINVGLVVLLIKSGATYFIVNPAYVSAPVNLLINALGFAFCWLFIAFLVNKFPLYQILGVVGLLLVASVADHYLKGFNPITIPLIILFWLSVARFILPQFFQKYKIAILSVYGLILAYFFVFRTMPNYAEDHHQTFLNFILIPIPAFAVLWGYEQWRWLKMLKTDKANAELTLLKSQVNPHFFFNTLNNLYGLVVEKSPQAPEVVLKLSDMMRYTIYEGKEELVNLTDEVNYLETYIELHKIRYQKKVDIQFTHQVEKEFRLAPLLFIILLENAFKHGVERLTENAYIHIDLKAQDHQIFFTIENNYETDDVQRKAGIGLDNLKKRLMHIYPKQHELKIEKTDTTYKAYLNLHLN